MLKQGNAHFVPWADIDEWKDVREKIFSNNVDNLIRAYEIITMWKHKSNNLPAYIECTAGILQVMVQEFKMCNLPESVLDGILFKEYDLRLSYSTSLIRFVNHVYSVSESKTDSLYRAAKVQNIPDWVITVRHDAAHGRELPALETLHMAAEICLQWLLKNYWFEEASYMSDFKSSGKVSGDDVIPDKLNLLPVYEMSIKIWKVCCDSATKSLIHVSQLPVDQINYITKLVDLCHKNDFIRKNLCKNIEYIKMYIKCSEASENGHSKGELTLQNLKSDILNFLRILTIAAASKDLFTQSLLQSDFMLDVNRKEWKGIIKTVQTLRCLKPFMRSIFSIAANGNKNALTLLIKLAPIIEFLKRNWPVYLKLCSEVDLNVSQTELKRTVFKRDACNTQKLPFLPRLQRPPKITLEMLEDLLLHPLNYPHNLILKYLNLIEPPLPQALHRQIENLLQIYCASTPKTDSPDENIKLYTVEDLELNNLNRSKEIPSTPDLSEGHVWKKSDIGVNKWNRCPIGLSPNQTVVDCTLPKDLKWKVRTTKSLKKRVSTPLIKHMVEMKKIQTESPRPN